MQENRVILTWEAICDITDIADYIETEFSFDRANRFREDIKKQIKMLGVIGNAFPKTHIYYRNYCIFKKSYPPSIIFYIINESEHEVHVLRVLREERNWRNVLGRHQNYTYL